MTTALTTAARFRRRRRNAWVQVPGASATSSSSSVMTADVADRSADISAHLDPRIQNRVDDIHQEVSAGDQDGVEERHTHHHRVVARGHPLDEKLAHSGEREDVFDN